MKPWKSVLIACLLIPVSLAIAAQQPQRDPEQYIKMLESERRVQNLQIDRVVETLKLTPGQQVADIGAGSGLFTRPIARKVGEKGTVYAVDIDPDLLKHIDKTARDEKLSNVRTVLAAEDDPRIPEPVDLVVIIDTLHHINNQPVYLKNLRRYLRPSARIAVIDFTEIWPPGHEQMKFSLEQLEGWMKGAGFARVEKHDFLNNNFFVIYR